MSIDNNYSRSFRKLLTKEKMHWYRLQQKKSFLFPCKKKRNTFEFCINTVLTKWKGPTIVLL